MSDPTTQPGPDASVDEIEADIERTRNELGETVDALAAKLDVKGRASDKVQDVKAQAAQAAQSARQQAVNSAAAAKNAATDSTGRPKPELGMAIVGLAVLVGLVVWWRRR